jgi:putative SOS response-associated peptidase YedK
MCGRYTIYTKKDALEQRFNAALEESFVPRYNAAPSQLLPIIRNDNPAAITLVSWGFLPSWVKDFEKMKPQINARAESVTEKPYWRSAFKKHRCLIPSTGYYEWQKAAGGKQPYFIHLENSEPFAMAGLFSTYTNQAGEVASGYAVITTAANKQLADIHHRMPVILNQNDEQPWLDPELPAADAKSLLQSYPSVDMEAYPVSTRVNSPRQESPQLITPASSLGEPDQT